MPEGNRIRLWIVDHTGNRRREARVEADIEVRELVPPLIAALQLPSTSPDGEPISWHVAVAGRTLGPGETLTSAGVQEGDELTLAPELTAGCFLAGTKILAPDGSSVPIECMRAGDAVLSYDVKQGAAVRATVSRTLTCSAMGHLVVNETLAVTDTHLLYANGHWTKVANLEVGDQLLTPDGTPVKVRSITHVVGPTMVHNLHLATATHAFFANGFLVHNANLKEAVAEQRWRDALDMLPDPETPAHSLLSLNLHGPVGSDRIRLLEHKQSGDRELPFLHDHGSDSARLMKWYLGEVHSVLSEVVRERAHLVERRSEMRLPARCRVGVPVDLSFRISTEEVRDSTLKRILSLPLFQGDSYTLQLLVRAPGFDVKPSAAKLVVPFDGASEPARFVVVPLRPGDHTVQLEAFLGSDRIGLLAAHTSVEELR